MLSKSETPAYWAVVPAAGVGRRMAAECPKQYLQIQGSPILRLTLERLHAVSALQRIVLLTHPRDRHLQPGMLSGLERVVSASGGAERADSVFLGLQALADVAREDDWVLVHDVVRPCVTPGDIRLLMATLDNDPVGGILASPLRETLKRVNQEQRIEATVDRGHLWAAATPQQFRYGLLYRALESALQQGYKATDEAAAMELAGHAPKVVAGRSDNIKITAPADLMLAQAILQQQAHEQNEQELEQ